MNIISISRSENPTKGFCLEILTKEKGDFPVIVGSEAISRKVDCDEDAFVTVYESYDIWDTRLPFNESVFKEDFYLNLKIQSGSDFLFPVIAIDQNQNELMVAWAKESSVQITLKKGLGTYFSRSRGKEWTKGEESGHIQKITKIEYVAKPFYLIYHVNQTGSACHTGYYTCFFREIERNGNLIQLTIPKIEVLKNE